MLAARSIRTSSGVFASRFENLLSVRFCYQTRAMATIKDSVPHVVRTAEDRRQEQLHRVVLNRVELVNKNVRLFQLIFPDGPVRHLPGQYVDLHIPEVETVGGFTITSPPQTAITPVSATGQRRQEPFIELAVQRSPNNPPAAFLYQEPPTILDTPMSVRIGGNFTYPPYSLTLQEFQRIDTVVFIAGGIGINPLMSMISAMDIAGAARLDGMKPKLRVLYSSKREIDDERGRDQGEQVLFEQRLSMIAKRWQNQPGVDLQYTFFETSKSEASVPGLAQMDHVQRYQRRMTHDDVFTALGSEAERQNTLVYVCGHPGMTDEYISLLSQSAGLDEKRVLCEKWW